MSFKLNELCKILGGELVGNGDLDITGIQKIDEASESEISFLHNPKYFAKIATTKATACIVPLNFEYEGDISLIKVADPYIGFLQVLKKFHPEKRLVKEGVHQSAVIAETAKIGKNPAISHFVSIGENVVIGDNVQIAPRVTIGDGVVIGDNVILHAGVSIRHECKIGNNCEIQDGAVIGSDGFGFSPISGRYEKIPQVGNVILEDDVEIGANTTIDRATMGSTIVKKGTKLDNLIQIAHNVEVGENTVIAAQSGVSGSTKIGNGCKIGGQVGLAGHLNVGNGVMIGAQAGISGSVKDGSIVTGTPARDLKKMRMIDGALGRLPDLIYKIREIEKKLK